jgi:hypothetical protein
MKETYYFSHDYNARNDEKIIKLIQKEGWEAYGIYWAVVEKIYEAGGYIDEDYECIAYDLRFECERITKIIRGYNLFTVASKKITSDSILARLRKRKGISEANRQNARKRWDKTKTGDATALPIKCERNALKKRKEKKKKVKSKGVHFVPPTLSEVNSYLNENEYSINGENFIDFYSSKGWMVGTKSNNPDLYE